MSPCPEIVGVHWNLQCNSLNWTYHYDADGFHQFRVLIRVLQLISVLNHSRDSFILIKVNTLSPCPEIVSVHWNFQCISLNWTYLYDAVGFIQWRVLIRVLELISVPNHSKDSFIIIKFNTLSPCPENVSVHWTSQCNSLNWTYLYDADRIPSISGFDSGSRAHFRFESFQGFIYFNKIQHFDPVSGDC